MYNKKCCIMGCKYIFGSPWVCTHPKYIGCDGIGVGLTEMEKEFVKRLGCASFEPDKNRFDVEDYYLDKGK